MLPRSCRPASWTIIKNLLGLVGLGQYTFDGGDPEIDYQLKELLDDTWKQLHVKQEETNLIANDSVYNVAMAA